MSREQCIQMALTIFIFAAIVFITWLAGKVD